MIKNPAKMISPALWTALGSFYVIPLGAQTQHLTDGEPTPREEEIRWLTNRARFDRSAENATRRTNFTDIPASSGPLAPHHSLTLAARHHSEDMARRDRFQHETIPGSTYYNASTQPLPWDRFRAEGYGSSRLKGENITAGHALAEDAYESWWESTGHRQSLGNAQFTEIGNGYFFLREATYDHYYTMDLGARTPSYFTGTLFNDADKNGKYTQGEGVPGVRVFLRANGQDHTVFDVSVAAGSFAIPVETIARGTAVEVWLRNDTRAAVTLSIPRDYRTLEAIPLPAGGSQIAGTITHPGAAVNFGFRNLKRAQTPAPVPLPAVTLTRSGTAFVLTWPSQTGLQYQSQWSASLTGGWTPFTSTFQNGTGALMTQTDAQTAGIAPRRYYRVAVRRP